MVKLVEFGAPSHLRDQAPAFSVYDLLKELSVPLELAHSLSALMRRQIVDVVVTITWVIAVVVVDVFFLVFVMNFVIVDLELVLV